MNLKINRYSSQYIKDNTRQKNDNGNESPIGYWAYWMSLPLVNGGPFKTEQEAKERIKKEKSRMKDALNFLEKKYDKMAKDPDFDESKIPGMISEIKISLEEMNDSAFKIVKKRG